MSVQVRTTPGPVRPELGRFGTTTVVHDERSCSETKPSGGPRFVSRFLEQPQGAFEATKPPPYNCTIYSSIILADWLNAHAVLTESQGSPCCAPWHFAAVDCMAGCGGPRATCRPAVPRGCSQVHPALWRYKARTHDASRRLQSTQGFRRRLRGKASPWAAKRRPAASMMRNAIGRAVALGSRRADAVASSNGSGARRRFLGPALDAWERTWASYAAQQREGGTASQTSPVNQGFPQRSPCVALLGHQMQPRKTRRRRSEALEPDRVVGPRGRPP